MAPLGSGPVGESGFGARSAPPAVAGQDRHHSTRSGLAQVGAKWEPSGMALAQVGGACRYKEALALYYRALQISESSYGSEHPDVAERGHRSPDRPLLPHNARTTRAPPAQD